MDIRSQEASHAFPLEGCVIALYGKFLDTHGEFFANGIVGSQSVTSLT